MRSIWEVLKVIVEPSGAVAYAAIIEGSALPSLPPNSRVAMLLTGGNLDLDHLPWQAPAHP
jgi:threonine dehydratase